MLCAKFAKRRHVPILCDSLRSPREIEAAERGTHRPSGLVLDHVGDELFVGAEAHGDEFGDALFLHSDTKNTV